MIRIVLIGLMAVMLSWACAEAIDLSVPNRHSDETVMYLLYGDESPGS